MRRPTSRSLLRRVAAALVGLAAALTPAAAAVAAPASGVSPAAVTAIGDVQDFTIASFDADYELGRDAEGRATLHVVETIVAVFPDYDQNRGIERAIPTSYARVDLGLSIARVTDGDGNPIAYSTYEQNSGSSFLVLRIGDPGSYAHGRQSYVIEYEMRDVVRTFSDTDADEFYWDINGDGWAQPFDSVTARLHLDATLRAAATGEVACYRGGYGDTTPCEVEATDDGFATSEVGLERYQTVTWAIAFERGTFANPPLPTDSWIVRVVPWVLLGIVAACVGIVVWLRVRVFRDAPGRGIVIPQYEGYPELGIMEAASLLGVPSKGLPAQFVQLVVTRAARLIDRGEEAGSKRYRLELVDPAGLDSDDAIAVASIFGGTKRGETVDLDRQNRKLGDRLQTLTSKVSASVARQYRMRRKSPWTLVVRLALFAAVLAAAAVLLWAAEAGAGSPLLTWQLVGGVFAVSIVAFVLAGSPARLTREGSLAREHLEGIRDYLRLAEADRIRVLQSPEGAERTRVDPADREAVVKLNERLLPYAILWGVEERWQHELGTQYATTPTELAPTVSALPLASFATGYTAASFATTPPPSSSSGSSWSGSGGSSFSGGSSGGGFSGGGGGGGGGGGW